MSSRQDFVDKYGSFIHKETKGTGIFAGTLISQAILESSGKNTDGDWVVGGSKLSRNSNNYFGIKADSRWKGRTYNIDTGEVNSKGEKYIEKNASFRAYNSVKDSIKDYIRFLKANDRYRKNGVFDAKNVKEQAIALKKAGYATATNYADVVNNIYVSLKPKIEDSYKKYLNYKLVRLAIISALSVGLIITSIYFIKKYKK